jgi:Domain of unknown function (DUF4345)
MMLSTLRVLIAALGVSALAIALSIFVLGAAQTAWAGERAYDLLTGWRGPPSPDWPASMDNELRFYSALWGGYGLLLLAAARDMARWDRAVPWLAGVFFLGGLGRMVSVLEVGPPHPFFLMLAGVELLLPPVLIGLWLMSKRAAPEQTAAP